MSELYEVYCEEEVIQLLKKDDRIVFNQLYKKYAPYLYSVINKIVADDHIAQDVLQDTFTKIWAKIEQFNPDKGRLFTWMINIARNSAKDIARTKSDKLKQKSQSEEVMNYMPAKSPVQIDTIDIKSLVSKLSPKYCIIVQMFYYQGYSITDISTSLCIPEGTVKTRLRTGVQLLRDKFYYTDAVLG